ncbi:flagellar hook-length control protein FliK [Paenibacillus aceti]|uniref:Flagellar hook-length control protein-like C-terminal domain-containing protein n=1 Tax=Paenibacillus aceti TaxID=1820010 RepID=A0ABQ1VT38_9BACL|nr:flagellar hook-length control protein FliK [Paenibacillus aceti]GGF96746.1 hypothetical protein GCM10010913_18010 [Paenibacillus aceti]
MTQAVTNLFTGNQASSVLSAGGGKGAASVDPSQSFSQAMLNLMGGGGQSQQVQLLTQLNALLGGAAEMAGEEVQTDSQTEALDNLMDSLLQQLEQLDDALVDNPSLLSALQSWIIQAQQSLQPNEAASGMDTAVPAEEQLPVLAQHAETIKFSLHDTLLQLAATHIESKAAGATAGANAQPFEHMLGSLKSILDATGVKAEVKDTAAESSRSIAGNKGTDVLLHLTANKVLGTENGKAVSARQEVVPAIHLAGKTGLSASEALTSTGNVQQLEGIEKSGSASSADDMPSLQFGQVVTAGQLALRDAGAAQLTVKAPPVPVENFGKEVGQFLINKLDIIKAHGMSEARISLNPQHLGSVDVQIKMQGGQLVAQFITEHAFAKESLEAQMSQLRSALQAQGLQVSKLEVTQNTSLSSHMYHDGRQQPGSGTGQQQQGKRRDVTTGTEEELLSVYDLNEEWNDWVSEVRASAMNLGSSFVARA